MRFCDGNHFFPAAGRLALIAPGKRPAKESQMTRPTIAPTYPSQPAAKAASLVEALASPEFVTVAVFCAIGLLLTLNVMLRLPDFVAMLG
jgi:hypothetical protein